MNYNKVCVFIYLILLCLFQFIIIISIEDSCKWIVNKNNSPEVYYVNMDMSISRKETIENHLKQVGFRYYRVRGLTYQEIYLPPDIENTWRTASCKLQTTWIPPNKLDSNYNFTSSEYSSYTAYTASLCGRRKKNTQKELGCTASHLVAMHKAIYSTTAKSRYALIVEDDVYFPFNIDFNALAQSAPERFGILQLFNSNEASMKESWDRYIKNNNNLWIKRHPIKFMDFWSTCAFLIDRFVMKPVIDNVYKEINGWIELKMSAGLTHPCVPKECCEENNVFILKPPCVFAPRGYQADSYLYAMTTTYTLSIPIITNGQGGNQSTFHQDHVSMVHKNAFRRQRQYINELILKNISPPNFIKPACKNPLDIDMM